MRSALLASLLVVSCASTGSGPEAGNKPASKPALPPQPAILATEKISEELVVRQIEPRTWVVTHLVPYPANSLVVEADNGSLLLVDTPWTPAATGQMLDFFEKKLGKRKIDAFVSHFHLDALGGLPELRRRGIGVRAHGAVHDMLDERGEAARQSLVDGLADRPELAASFAKAEMLRPPSRYVAGKFTLPLGTGAENYALLNPGPSHSPDLTMVWLIERRILFGSCAVRGTGSLGPTTDADLASWPAVIRELQALDPLIVVPGHGDRLDPGQLADTLALLAKAQPEQAK